MNLLAAGFDGGRLGQVGGQTVRCEGFNVHLDQAYKRASVIGTLASAAIDDNADAGDFPAVGADDIDRFLDAPTAGDDVLGHNEPFVRPNLKTAAQDEATGLFLDEDVALPEGSPHFLADNDSAEGRGDDGVALDAAQLIGEPSADVCSNIGVLQEQGALEELPATQTGPQNEMAVEQRPGLAKEREQIVAH
jgi:hypothetical protein